MKFTGRQEGDQVTYGSVCSGIEAATVAWHPLGWRPAWFAEIDPFCCALLSYRYPQIKNYGDFTKIGPDAGPIDILVGGTPCQSFSVAGLRGGLDDPRGNLMLEYLRLAGRLRPRWLVWENVPGVLSIDGGRTFGIVLGTLAELGYGFAYRVLDAQYFGVPQRRRRVFVVGHLGDWRRAAAVLFECYSLSRYPPSRREAGKEVAHELAPSLTSNGRGVERTGESRGQDPVVAMCLNDKGGIGRIDGESETFVCTGQGWHDRSDVAKTLRKGDDAGGGQARGVAPTLYARPPGTDLDTADSLIPVAFSAKDHGADAAENVSPILRASGNGMAVAFQENFQHEFRETKMAACLLSSGGSRPGQGYPAVRIDMAVRRLTPRECERLQGFEDDYTLIPYRGKPAADGPRYKAIGNSMAVPVMRWIGERIQAVEDLCH